MGNTHRVNIRQVATTRMFQQKTNIKIDNQSSEYHQIGVNRASNHSNKSKDDEAWRRLLGIEDYDYKNKPHSLERHRKY